MKKIMAGLGLLVFLLPVLSRAADFEAGQNYSLPGGTATADNLYVGAQNVNVGGEVKGDLLAAGANVFLTGKADQDVFAAGGTVTLNGPVAGDARVAGGTVILSAPIAGDLVAAGGQLHVLNNVAVGKDLRLFGGQIEMSGSVKGGAKIYGGQVYLNGVFENGVTVQAEELTLGPNAVVKGDLVYTSPKIATISQGASVTGNTTYHQSNTGQKAAQKAESFLTAWWFLELCMVLLVALLLTQIWPNQSRAWTDTLRRNFGWEMLRGLVTLIVVPIAVLIALVTVVGVLPGLLALAAYFSLIVLGSVLANIFAAMMLGQWVFRKEGEDMRWYVIVLGIIVYRLLMLIPVLGWILSFVLFLAAFGTLVNAGWQALRPKK